MPGSLRWLVRLLWLFDSGLLLYWSGRLVLNTRFTVKKTAFVVIMIGFNWLCLSLMCAVFNAVMSQRDDRLTSRGMATLPADCRRGIEALLAGKSMAQFNHDIGWVPRPGYQSQNYRVTQQGVRATKVYPFPPPDPSKRLLCMGDSFTFGTAVGNAETYPAHGEEIMPGSEWINFGMPATCLTQSYLRYLRDGRKFGGKHVIIGFMSNDAERTVNCFRPFVNPDSGAPLTKPFAKFSDGYFTIEPNPYNSLDDYKNMLANEREELARLRQLDYLTWSGERTSINPVIRTFTYIYEVRQLEQTVNDLLDPRLPFTRGLRRLLPPDVYGRSIYDPKYIGFQAITGLFERFRKQVVEDGSEPFVVIFPGPLDVKDYQDKKACQYASLVAFLKSNGYAYLDFLDPLVGRHRSDLSYKSLFVNNHYQGHINKEVAEEIIKAVKP